MSERIIIEKGGKRWEVVGNGINIGKWNDSDCLVTYDFTRNIYTLMKPLTSVVHTENNAVIARLESENAKMREALEIILAFRTSPAKWLEINEMYHKAYDAVRKAQTIMKGEAK